MANDVRLEPMATLETHGYETFKTVCKDAEIHWIRDGILKEEGQICYFTTVSELDLLPGLKAMQLTIPRSRPLWRDTDYLVQLHGEIVRISQEKAESE